MKYLYTISLFLYHKIIFLFSFFNKKAKAWYQGRVGLITKIQNDLSQESMPILWVHAASVGEFEQGRPLIEALKSTYPQHKILLTFFSPSAYQLHNQYPLADYIYYLPLDTAFNAKALITAGSIQAAFFIKYEFWYYYLRELKNQNIPTFLVSAKFRPSQLFFKSYGGFFRSILRFFSHIFVQDKESEKLLQVLGTSSPTITISGDTRMDRVLQIKEEKRTFTEIEAFKGNRTLLVAGSTWPEDEDILSEMLKVYQSTQEYALVLAPHEIDERHLQKIEHIFQRFKCLRYSQATRRNVQDVDVLIIDNIGMLSSLYAYADWAYIGGGFGKGIHNILEAVVYNIAVVFGPNYQKFKEANDLLQLRLARTINNAEDLISLSKELLEKDKRIQLLATAEAFCLQSKGATMQIVREIQKYNL